MEHCSNQIVAYVTPELRKLLDRDRLKMGHRLSVSSYVESILRRHLARKQRTA